MPQFIDQIPQVLPANQIPFVNEKSFCPQNFDDRASFTNFFKKQLDDSFTISWWGRFEAIAAGSGEYFAVFANHNSATGGESDGIYVFMAGFLNNVRIDFSFCDSSPSNDGRVVWDLTSINTNEWYHFAITYDGSRNFSTGVKLYVNGQDVTTIDRTSVIEPPATGGTIAYANANAYVGDTPNLSLEAGEDPCQLDEVSLWNLAFTPAQILEIYNFSVPNNLKLHSVYVASASNGEAWYRFEEPINAGNACVDSFGNHNGNYHTTVTPSTQCTESPSFLLNKSFLVGVNGGASEGISMPQFFEKSFDDGLSISYWLKAVAGGAYGMNYGNHNGGSPTKDGFNFSFFNLSGGPSSMIWSWSTVSTQYGETLAGINFTPGVWHHFVMTYKGSRLPWNDNMKLYQDGVEVTTYPGTVIGGGDPPVSGDPIYANANFKFFTDRPGIGAGANMAVASMTFWGKELTPAEVAEEYNSGVPIDNRTHSQASIIESYFNFVHDDIDGGNTCYDVIGGNHGVYEANVTTVSNQSSDHP